MKSHNIKYPKFLYHYTNVEALAYILATKKIRFSKLSNVDDVNEGKNKHFDHLRNFYFISCWTSSREESIPFWSMYTNDMCGVRIKLPSFPFIAHTIPYINYGVNVNVQKSIFSEEEVFGEDHVVYPFEEILGKMNYTKDKELLNPQLIEVTDTPEKYSANFKFSKYGVFKLNHWRFQSEWRYWAVAFPKVVAQNSEYEALIKFVEGKYEDISINQLFAELRPEVFNNIEILLGPKQNSAQKLIVKSLIKEFCPTAKIKESVLTGTIR
jgi:hypothetical protein